jgi:CheY-like chemotaxis protein
MTTTAPTPKDVQILLVEDNPGDSRLAREAFEEIGADVALSVVENGREALAFLRREREFADAARPQLIILDLNLPRMNGDEVLAEIKSDEEFRRIPVIVLTTVTDESAVAELYDKHANAFVTKPNTVSQFIEMIGSVESFWLSNATLPRREANE